MYRVKSVTKQGCAFPCVLQKEADEETYSGYYFAENAQTGFIYPIMVRGGRRPNDADGR